MENRLTIEWNNDGVPTVRHDFVLVTDEVISELIDELSDRIVDDIDPEQLVDYDDYEVSIGYHNDVVLDRVGVNDISYEIRDIVRRVVRSYFEQYQDSVRREQEQQIQEAQPEPENTEVQASDLLENNNVNINPND